MSSKHTDGLISALFTPLLSDGQVNYELIPSLVEHLTKIGNTGVFICGSNGEGPNLTLEERMQITELILSVNNKRLKTIVHDMPPIVAVMLSLPLPDSISNPTLCRIWLIVWLK
jgi:dihydrodipicolinate synthase/N-acetylneuraminate lyase